jgi:transglutaminase-like putative cysteine protease
MRIFSIRTVRRLLAPACLGLALGGCQTDGSNDVARVLLGPMAARQNAPAAAAPAPGRYDTAALELANRLIEGQGVAGDVYGGAAVLERLGQSGNINAQMSLANLYTGLAGMPRNPGASAYWIKKAADTGNLEAQATYGLYLSNGFGVEKNSEEAVRWLRRAADGRHGTAMRWLGESYLDGLGVGEDHAAAYAWFRLAELNSRTEETRNSAARGRIEAALLLLPAEVEVGQSLADQWRPGRDIASGQRSPASIRNAEYRVASVSPPPASDAAAEEAPSEVSKLHWDFAIEADGSYTLIAEGIYLARNSSAAHEMAQLPFTYHNKMETFEVLEAYTIKSDGRRLPVAPSAILTQAAPRNATAPMFADESQKVLIYPSVEAGDSVYYRIKYVRQPYFPGHFTFSRYFERTSVLRDVRIRVSVPESKALRTEVHDLKASRRVENGRAVYEWTWQNLKAEPDLEPALDGFDRAPRLFVSTFKDYTDVGRGYAEMARANTAVTPAVTALAEEITAGITDKRRQAEAIYDWVRQRIRYVQINLGVAGSYVPHAVDSIIANRYGDCKDHAALFSALLAAKGIASETVLINSGNSYMLASAPTFASLNHAITWLPDFNLYVDTTAAVAPFGILPFDQYGKPVVHASITNPRVSRVPLLDGNTATITTKVNLKLGADGRFIGDADSSGTGPFAVLMRQRAMQIQSVGADQAAKDNLRGFGFDGTGRFQVDDIYRSDAAYRVTGRFQTAARRDLLTGSSFRPVGLLTVGAVPADMLLGPIGLIDPQGQLPTPCFSGSQVQEISIELPAGKRLRELPKGLDLKNKAASYRSVWTQAGKTVTVRREFKSNVKEPVCVGETRRLASRMLDEIRGDYYASLTLADD